MTTSAGGSHPSLAAAASVHLEIDNGLATISIDRADVRNALDRPTWGALAERLDQIRNRYRETRVVLLKSSGTKAFVAGADIRELRHVTGSREAIRSYVGLIESVMKRLESLPQPVIAVAGGMPSVPGSS